MLNVAPNTWEYDMSMDTWRLSKSVAIAFICSVALTACGSNPTDTSSESKVSGAVFSVSCEFGWANCYSEARRRCADGGFEEIDRNGIERVAGENSPSSSELVRVEAMNRTMTVRCK